MLPKQEIPTGIRPEILELLSRTQRTAFVNRESELADMRAATEDLFNGKLCLAVWAFYGVGGVGKTRLLDEYIHCWDWHDWEGRYLISVSLQTHNFLAPLLEIRRRFPFDADMFDAALTIYWEAIGESRRIQDFFGNLKASFITRTLATVSSVPLDIIGEGYRRVIDFLTTRRYHAQAELLAIAYGGRANMADTDKLRDLLPVFLGEAFRDARNANLGHFVFAFDRYDNQPLLPKGRQGEWLEAFAVSCGTGLFLLGSREKVVWPSSSVKVENREIKVLAHGYADEMLKSREVHDPYEREMIIAAAGRLPLKIELLAICSGRLDRAKLLHATRIDDHVMDVLAEHIPESAHPLLPLLAASGMFNLEILANLVREFSISLTHFEQKKLLELSFVERCKESPPFYKLHDLLITPLLRKIDTEEASRCLKVLLAYAQRALLGGEHEVAQTIFSMVVNALHVTGLNDIHLNEKSIDLAYSLYDTGYWREMEDIVSSAEKIGCSASAVSEFARALCWRKLRPASETVGAFLRLNTYLGMIGRHRLSVETELAYARSLTGQYDEAARQFRELYNSVLYQPLTRNVRRVHLVFGDILTLQGRFRQALEPFCILTNSTRSCEGNEIEFAEALRHQGHIQRFNFDFALAEERYKIATGFAQMHHSEALAAKLSTNMAETYCWSDPRRALDHATDAIERNRRLRNRIEIGKALAAQAIAFAALGRCDDAMHAATEARKVQSTEGYASGVLFADLAGYMVATKSRDQIRAVAFRDQVYAATRQLGVYRFLEIYVAALDCDDDRLCALLDEFEWLEADRMIDGVEILRQRFL